jgi:hypothetical protein
MRPNEPDVCSSSSLFSANFFGGGIFMKSTFISSSSVDLLKNLMIFQNTKQELLDKRYQKVQFRMFLQFMDVEDTCLI